MDEHERRVIELCQAAVERLAEALPDAEIGALLRTGDILRHVAHSGILRVIYEVRREQGGVAWRAAETGLLQLVEDVRSDPDYLASDARVHSEVAAPVVVRNHVVLVLDIEFPGRVFTSEETETIEAEAALLGQAVEAGVYSE